MGGFLPIQRLSVDQSLPPFVSSQRRCEYVKKGEKNHNTWISQPGSGMDKRQCFIQILYHPEAKQLKLGINFYGKGRVVMDEKLACHKSINVFFQTNAWIDIHLCSKWIDTTLSTFVLDEKLETVLLLDNISCQELDGLKDKVSTIKKLCWYGSKEGTDLWQPIEAGYADVVKKLLGIQREEWLDKDEHVGRWYDGQSFSAKERKILISLWAGEAWDWRRWPPCETWRLAELCCSTTITVWTDQHTTCSTSALCSKVWWRRWLRQEWWQQCWRIHRICSAWRRCKHFWPAWSILLLMSF